MTTRFQSEGCRIFRCEHAADRLKARLAGERKAVLTLSRDELHELATQLEEVTAIAKRYHLERAQAGSLPPDAFPSPTE